MDKLKYLRRVPLFRELPNSDIKKLSAITKIRKYKAGEKIFSANSAGAHLFVVLSGKVKIFASSDQKNKILAYLGPGEFFGEMALLDLEPRSATALAQEPCELFVVNKNDFRRLLTKDPKISFKVMQTLSKRLRSADREIEALAFEHVLGRVAGVLVDLAEKYGEETERGKHIEMPLNHREIAELAGTGREVVTRILTQFRKLNCIAYGKHQITIIDPDKLKRWT